MSVGLKGREQVFDEFLRLSALRTQTHQRRVDDDTVEPGAQLRVPFERADRPEGAEVGRLEYVAGVFVASNEALRDGEQASAVLSDQQLVRPILTAAQGRDEGGFIDVH